MERSKSEHFHKKSYLVNIAIESLKKREVADFIIENSNQLDLKDHNVESLQADFVQFKKDFDKLKDLQTKKDYKVIETLLTTSSRVEYLLNLKV